MPPVPSVLGFARLKVLFSKAGMGACSFQGTNKGPSELKVKADARALWILVPRDHQVREGVTVRAGSGSWYSGEEGWRVQNDDQEKLYVGSQVTHEGTSFTFLPPCNCQ